MEPTVDPYLSPKKRRGISLQRLFYIGVWMKGLTGLFEAFGGVLLWFLNPEILHKIAALFVRHELIEHSDNLIVRIIRHLFAGWTLNTQHFGAIYLVINGLISAGLAAGLLRRKRWAYPLAAALLGLFVIYQLHRMMRTHSEGLLFLSVLDLVIIFLILNEYKKQPERGRRG